MPTFEQIPPLPKSAGLARKTRPASLDRALPSPRVPAVNPTAPSSTTSEHEKARRALLRAQPWAKLAKQLTAIAFKRIKGRSMEDAQDLAQSAMTAAYEPVATGGWNPERGALENFLVARVLSGTQNERRRKRNVCEVWLDEEADDDSGSIGKHEKHLAVDAPSAEEALDRLRFASTFEERLRTRVTGDALCLELIERMREGISLHGDLCAAIARTLGEQPDSAVRGARRRLQYHAREILRDLSAVAIGPESARSPARGKEVTQ
jgi:DNA-directed RNA polymerase specialized sigma24 family protein